MQRRRSIDPRSGAQSTMPQPDGCCDKLCCRSLPLVMGRSLLRKSLRRPLTVDHLRVEHVENPLGLGTRAPRFSWWMHGRAAASRKRSIRCRWRAPPTISTRGRRLVWDSTRREVGESTFRPYEGPGGRAASALLLARSRVGLDGPRVRLERAGLVGDGPAGAVRLDGAVDRARPAGGRRVPQPSPMLRRAFALKATVRSARVYVTSHGLYELSINGKRVGDDVLTPGWTSYETRLQYQTYDVTQLLRRGDNVVGALLGNGWYRGQIGFQKQRNHYGDRAGAARAARRHLRRRHARDDRDRTRSGRRRPARFSCPRSTTARPTTRASRTGWDAPGFDDTSWTGVRVAEHPKDNLIAPEGPPVRRIEELTPIKILTSPSGQTSSTWARTWSAGCGSRVEGPAGTTVTLRHAEVLDRRATSTPRTSVPRRSRSRYTLKGGGAGSLRAALHVPGLPLRRWSRAIPGTLALDSLTGIVVHSDDGAGRASSRRRTR